MDYCSDVDYLSSIYYALLSHFTHQQSTGGVNGYVNDYVNNVQFFTGVGWTTVEYCFTLSCHFEHLNGSDPVICKESVPLFF